MVPPLLAILVWPLISIAFFQKLRLPLAILVTILGGFLVLPENTALDLPGIPSLNKYSVPALTALVLALVFADRAASGGRPASLIPRRTGILILIVTLGVGTMMTVMTNSDVLVYGLTTLPGLRPYDAVSMVVGAVFTVLPLLLARRFIADPESQRLLLLVLCVAALGYSLLALFEVRMSPQLNNWVYGFFPHSWIQHIRGGSFRPVVFLQHGLVLGIFLCMTILATVALVRLDAQRRGLFVLAALWLFGTLLLSRNFGALLITAVLLPAILFLGVRGQLLAAAIISGMFLTYPVLRTSSIFPLDQIFQIIENINSERAGSLMTRLYYEEQLLAKASERPIFGWGGFGRSRIYDEGGARISISDGSWIIVLGVSGWVGYVALYGLLTSPIFLLFLQRQQKRIGIETSALAVILAANLMDLVPNSSNTPLTWLLAGALWGRLEWQAAQREAAESPVAVRRVGYTRLLEPTTAVEPDLTTSRRSQSHYTRQKTRIARKKPVLKSSPK
jgi:hypothetical protein